VAAPFLVGPYTGELAPQFRAPDCLARLAALPELLTLPSARLVASGRNRNIRIDLPVDGRSEAVIVKAFGKQFWFKDAHDLRYGSKARRSWLAATHLARHGVGTPPPIGYLERWQGKRLRESYFLSAYRHEVESFREALLTLYHEIPECERFMALLECVATGARHMHDAGFLHNDLGNQNVLLVPDGPGRWRDFQVIDLNRGRVRRELSLRERGRDLSRLSLPSHLLRLLIMLYWNGNPPAALLRWERAHRWLYSLHSGTRGWRHPIREARNRRQAAAESERQRYPAPRDMWIWDERSGQPISALLGRDRRHEYPLSRSTRMVCDTLKAAPSIWREYRRLLDGTFRQPVILSGRIGMTIEPSPASRDREIDMLAALGRIPALVRFYHHDSAAQRRWRAQLVRDVCRAGHPVAIALVQDRKAVRDPAAWRAFAEEVLEGAGDVIEWVEVGSNVNRSKWGIWDFRELRSLYAPVAELCARFPAVRFMGPGAIDFEYPFVVSALREWPAGVPLSALSHHLYVDRRGAPENYQGRFSSVEKFALARAIARCTPACDDRLIISEVNWPLAGTGVYSPIRAPYVPPGHHGSDGGVSESLYGDYLVRYLCLALGSGMVERVYWWRLVARGFGLVDDSDPAALRPGPAYAMLRAFLELLGESTLFDARLPARRRERHGRYRFAFRRPDGEIVVLTYAHGPELPFPSDETFGRAEDAFGRPLARPPERLTGQPVYLRAG